jgi:hypothetical protein
MFILLFDMPGGPVQTFSIAMEDGKFSLGSFGSSLSESTFWVCLIYGIFTNLQNYGIDQSYVQRYHTAKNEKEAKFSALFGGYFLAAYAIDQLGKKLLGREDQYELNQQFVGYSMVVTFVLDIVSGLFSISILHWILQFYTIFVVFEGARTLMKVNEEKLTRYTLIASVIIIVCPALIAAVFNELSVILN